MTRRPSLPLALACLVGGLVLAPTPALATLTSNVDGSGVLMITSDTAGETIRVACSDAGTVKINGATPGSGSTDCADITSIVVTAGGGDDDVDLIAVSPADFTSLTSTTVTGDDGNDGVEGSRVPDTINGGTGRDRITADPADDVIDGGGDADLLRASVRRDATIADVSFTTASGTQPVAGIESIRLRGSKRAQRIDASAFTGSLRVGAGAGDDRVIDGSGRNQLSGGASDDILVGGSDHDLLRPGGGDDRASGGRRSDLFYDGRGVDRYRGGPGGDAFSELVGRRNVYVGGPGRDALSTRVAERGTLTDTSVAADGRLARIRSIEDVGLSSLDEGGPLRLDASAFDGRAELGGGAEDDVLVGGSGRDRLYANAGDDTLVGNAGRDYLQGDDGFDRCDGGPGKDAVRNCER